MQCKWFWKCTQNPCNLTFCLIAYSSFRVQFYWVVCVEQLWSLHTTHVVFHQFLYLEHDDCLNSPVPPTMSTAYLLQLHVHLKNTLHEQNFVWNGTWFLISQEETDCSGGNPTIWRTCKFIASIIYNVRVDLPLKQQNSQTLNSW